jgi:hypothetical protein
MKTMGTVYLVLLIVCGLFASSGLIISKRPDAKQVFDKIAPYTGFMGVGLLVISILYLVKYILPYLTTFMGSFAGWMGIITVAVAILLGFLLGFGLISKLLGGKSPAAAEKGEAMRAKLAVSQIPLGLAGVGLGIYSMI